MVKACANLPKGALQDAEIDEHPARIEGFSPCMGEDAIIMTMQTLALSVKIGEKVGGRELGLYSGFIHSHKNIANHLAYSRRR